MAWEVGAYEGEQAQGGITLSADRADFNTNYFPATLGSDAPPVADGWSVGAYEGESLLPILTLDADRADFPINYFPATLQDASTGITLSAERADFGSEYFNAHIVTYVVGLKLSADRADFPINYFSADLVEATNNTIQITTEPAQDVFYQRRAGVNLALIDVGGTYAGDDPVSVEVRVTDAVTGAEVQGWSVVDAAPSGGTWSGSLDVLAHLNEVRLQARYSDAIGASTSGATTWSVGAIFAVIGQSLAAEWMTETTGMAPTDGTWRYSKANGYQKLTSSDGDGDKTYARDLRNALGVSVLVMNYGIGGRGLIPASDASRWLSDSGVSPWGLFMEGMTAVGGKLEGISWLQGTRDTQDPVQTYDDYKQGLVDFFTRARAQLVNGSLSPELPVAISQLGRFESIMPVENWQSIRRAQIDYTESDDYAFPFMLYDLPLRDYVHLTASGYASAAQRAAQIFYAQSDQGSIWESPKVTAAQQYNSDSYHVTILSRSGDLTPFTATGWEITDDNWQTTIPIDVVTRDSPFVYVIATSRPTSGQVRIRYAYGPVIDISETIRDTSPLELPLSHLNEIIVPNTGPSPITLDADRADFAVSYFEADVNLPAPDPIILDADRADFLLETYPATMVIGPLPLTLSAEMAVFNTQYYAADFIESVTNISWSLTEGSGTTVAKCSDPQYNGTVPSNMWEFVPSNNKLWPIDENTGALLNEVKTGTDEYDATIQEFTEGGWPQE